MAVCTCTRRAAGLVGRGVAATRALRLRSDRAWSRRRGGLASATMVRVPTVWLFLALLTLPACIKERRYLILEELQPGAAALGDGAELVGDVTGEAHYRQLLTLFALGNLRGAEGDLRTDAAHTLLEPETRIPLLDPLLRRVAALLEGTTRVDRAGRIAMGRALLAARELGADAVLAPRVEVVTRSLTFVVPLGWLYSTGAVEVSAKAVRLAAPTAPTAPEADAAAAGTGGTP